MKKKFILSIILLVLIGILSVILISSYIYFIERNLIRRVSLNHFYHQNEVSYFDDNEYIKEFIQNPLDYDVKVTTVGINSKSIEISDSDKTEMTGWLKGIVVKPEKYSEYFGRIFI